MDHTRYPKLALHRYVHGTRRQGRPKKRWIDRIFHIRVEICSKILANLLNRSYPIKQYFQGKLRKLYKDGLFSRLLKSTCPEFTKSHQYRRTDGLVGTGLMPYKAHSPKYKHSMLFSVPVYSKYEI